MARSDLFLPRAAGGRSLAVIKPPAVSASAPYDAASSSRRTAAWQASRLGPNTILWGSADQLRARSRHEIRNNPWAASAERTWKANAIGRGIQFQSKHPKRAIRKKIEDAFRRTVAVVDADGRQSFYGMQRLVASEIFQSGEVFTRFVVGETPDPKAVPLQIYTMESEQLPLWRNSASDTAIPKDSQIRAGIEFKGRRRVAYHFFKEHPGETMFFPLEGLQYERVPADQIIHTYEVLRSGQFRGQPHMTPALAMLYEIGQYWDAEIVRKKIVSMLAGFITKPGAGAGGPTPPNPNNLNSNDAGIVMGKMEAGTMQELLPGENIVFTNPPSDNTVEAFLYQALHALAAAMGITYEQLSGDLRGVSFSSIRAGINEFQRKCEQFQYDVIVDGFCWPFIRFWLRVAVFSGVLDLPDYATDPYQYEDGEWQTDGWPYVNPVEDVTAAKEAVRNGFSSRRVQAARRGEDVETIDAQQKADNESADAAGVLYDSDPRKAQKQTESATVDLKKPVTDDTGEIPEVKNASEK